MSAETDSILDELLWVIKNSDGVVGLSEGISLMPWTEVINLYAPSVKAAL